MIITNIGDTNGINMLLNGNNDMDSYVISCSNPCVLNPVIVHTDVIIASGYWRIYVFGPCLVEVVYIIFPGNHKGIDIISYVDNYILINPIYCWYSCDVQFPTLQWPYCNTESCTSLYIPMKSNHDSILQYVLYTPLCPAMGVE